MTTRYIIDIPSNRVIFFTQDPTVSVRAGDSAIVYEDMGSPPETMTLANAWNWKLFGRTFKRMEGDMPANPPGADTKVDTLNENKTETFKLLRIQINNSRKRIGDVLNYSSQVNDIIRAELRDSGLPQPMLTALAKVSNQSVEEYKKTAKEKLNKIDKILIQTEQWYQYYENRINACNTVDELAATRDEIGSRNFTLDLF